MDLRSSASSFNLPSMSVDERKENVVALLNVVATMRRGEPNERLVLRSLGNAVTAEPQSSALLQAFATEKLFEKFEESLVRPARPVQSRIMQHALDHIFAPSGEAPLLTRLNLISDPVFREASSAITMTNPAQRIQHVAHAVQSLRARSSLKYG